MTAKHSTALTLLLVSSFCVSINAWGTAFDTLRVGYRRSSTALQGRRDLDDDASWQSSLDNLEEMEIPLAFGGGVFLWDESLSDDVQAFDWALETSSCNGDECEECLIPDEFKKTESEAVDVLAFLGIRRAAPLQAEPLAWQ